MAVFPSAVVTDAQLGVAANGAETQLNGAINAAVTTVTVDDTTLFATSGYFVIGTEICSYTGKTATTFTGVTRGVDGSAAASHSDNDPVYGYIVAAHIDNLQEEVKAVEQNLADRIGLGTTEVATVVYTDYSATSTLVGWSSTTTKNVYYKRIGKTVIVWFRIVGTSNATTATLTIPFANAGGTVFSGCGFTVDNGTATTTGGLINLNDGVATVQCYKDMAGNAFTASGTKEVNGFLIYQAA